MYTYYALEFNLIISEFCIKYEYIDSWNDIKNTYSKPK